MSRGFIAKVSITIKAPAGKVWAALVDPAMIKKYLFGTDAVSDWRKGGPIVFKGEYQGRTYEDKGLILDLEPGRRLRYSHWSSLSGLPDTPENYHIVTMELRAEGTGTLLTLSQDNNPDEESRDHSQKTWEIVLGTMKKLLEE